MSLQINLVEEVAASCTCFCVALREYYITICLTVCLSVHAVDESDHKKKSKIVCHSYVSDLSEVGPLFLRGNCVGCCLCNASSNSKRRVLNRV